MPLPSQSASAVAPTSGERLRGRLMAQALGRLLDQVRGAREVLPHLSALERALLDGGPGVIDRVPPQGLAKMCSQLSSLPLPAEDPPLHDLLTRLMDALEARGQLSAPALRAQAPPPAPPRRLLMPRDDLPFDIEQTVVINEVSHSDFMRVVDGPTHRGTDNTGSQPR